MTNIGCLKINGAAADKLRNLFCTADDRASVQLFVSETRRCQAVAARSALRGIVHTCHPDRQGPFIIVKDDRGAPLLLENGQRSTLGISLSHRRDMVACAVSRHGEVGIDVEIVSPGRAFVELAEAAFGPQEVAEVARAGMAAFYRIWTLREALCKAVGRGFEMLVNGEDLIPPDDGSGLVQAIAADRRWRLTHLAVEDDYVLGLVEVEAGQRPFTRVPLT